MSQLRHTTQVGCDFLERGHMTIGSPGADSSNLVTRFIGDKPMVDVAAELFGQMPVLWGRYFTSVATSGLVEYRARRENQALRDRNIRVLPIARQTKHVDGTLAHGNADAQLNVEDLIKTFSPLDEVDQSVLVDAVGIIHPALKGASGTRPDG